MHNSRLKYIIRISMMFLLVFLGTFFLTQKVYAEGTTDLGTEDQGEDGYRPYTERNKAKTFGQERLSHMPIVDDNGTAITYTVEEFDVDGYTKNAGQITGSSADGYQIEFTNTHNDPATPTPSGDDDYVPPDTGDHTNTLPWGIALGVSLAAIIAAVIYRKRSE